MTYYRQPTQDDAYYLQLELDDLRSQMEAEREREYQEQQRRIQERQESYEWRQRQASTWPEALQNQATLMSAEAHLDDPEGALGEIDTWFSDGAAACRRALAIWHEEEQGIAPEIEALQKQIAALRDSVRLKTATRLREETNGRDGWRSVAGAINEYEEDAGVLSAWLNW